MDLCRDEEDERRFKKRLHAEGELRHTASGEGKGYGDSGAIQTHDLWNRNPMLYSLSYGAINRCKSNGFILFCQSLSTFFYSPRAKTSYRL